jgi:hypothetical protein
MIYRAHSCSHIRLHAAIHGMPDFTVDVGSSITFTSGEVIFADLLLLFQVSRAHRRQSKAATIHLRPWDVQVAHVSRKRAKCVVVKRPGYHMTIPTALAPRSQVPPVCGDPGNDRLGSSDGLISAYRYIRRLV